MASDKTSSSGRLAFRGPHTVIARFTLPFLLHPGPCAPLRGGRLVSVSESHFQQFPKALKCMFHKFFEWPANSSYNVLSWLCNNKRSWPFLIFRTPLLVRSAVPVHFLSVQDGGGAHVETTCAGTEAAISGWPLAYWFSHLFFSLSPIMPSRGCQTDWLE